MEESLAASGDEANQDRQPEQEHSLIGGARSSSGAGCRDENIPGTESKGKYFS
jgi:hypothetical protein